MWHPALDPARALLSGQPADAAPSLHIEDEDFAGAAATANGTTIGGQPVAAKSEIPLEPGSTIGRGTRRRFDSTYL